MENGSMNSDLLELYEYKLRKLLVKKQIEYELTRKLRELQETIYEQELEQEELRMELGELEESQVKILQELEEKRMEIGEL